MLDQARELCDSLANQDTFLNNIDIFSDFIKTKITLVEENNFMTNESRKFWNFFKNISKYSKGRSYWNGFLFDKDNILNPFQAKPKLLDFMKSIGMQPIPQKI